MINKDYRQRITGKGLQAKDDKHFNKVPRRTVSQHGGKFSHIQLTQKTVLFNTQNNQACIETGLAI